MPRNATAFATSSLAALGLAVLALVRQPVPSVPRRSHVPLPAIPRDVPRHVERSAGVKAAQRLNRAASVLAASVLADSAVEHYRGSFHNRAMITPLVTASLSLAVSAHGNADARPVAHRARDSIYAIAALTGLVGMAFHTYNISRKPGGLSWQNLFYAAPIGAPAALSLSGVMGFLSERVRDTTPGLSPTIGGLSAGRVVGIATSLGLLGTVGEAGLLHFRGAFQNPFMYAPVTVPPITAALLSSAALGRSGWRRPWLRGWLQLTALLGYAGAAFHLREVARQMGGWRNWTQNLLNGPLFPRPRALPVSPWLAWPPLGCWRTIPMTERYPGYDVMTKQWSPSWNAITRAVVQARLAVPREPRFFSADEWQTLRAVCARIMPQPPDQPQIPLPAYVDAKITEKHLDGYRHAELPEQGEAWRRGLAALDREAQDAHGARFHALAADLQDRLLRRMQAGELTSDAWAGMPCKPFFEHRVIADITHAYYAHPIAWNQIGFGGPASPRGYVRMGMDRRDPWEAAEAHPGEEARARRDNQRVG